MIRKLTMVLIAMMLITAGLQADAEYTEPVDFELQRLHGDKVSLSEYRGSWVVLNYWATWCAPCRKEIPELSALNDARDDVIVLGLAYEDTELENFDEFLEEFQPSFEILLVDVYAPPEPFGAPKVLPTTIILNPAGYPIKTYLGPVTREAIDSFIDTAITNGSQAQQ
jgi:thiol-disulfide isomerase/thioredoxin